MQVDTMREIYTAECVRVVQEGRLFHVTIRDCDHGESYDEDEELGGQCPYLEDALKAVGPWAEVADFDADESAFMETQTFMILCREAARCSECVSRKHCP